MSEYQEALSRLNMPERTPGLTISRSQFPISRKDTPWNYDRILKETLNTPLPKYSIPQRLFITNDGSISYTFPLDKQFTLAKGGRKAIAIREARLKTLNQDNFDENAEHLIETMLFTIHWEEIADPDNNGDVEINHDQEDLFVFRSYPIENYFYSIARNLCASINMALNDEFGDAVEYAVPVHDDKYIRLKINSSDTYKLNIVAEDFDVYIQNSSPNQPFSIIGLYGDDSKSFSFDKDNNIFAYFPNALVQPFSLCSTINPWSPGNVISSIDQFYPQLNKLFPYDNQQEIKLWFINQYGDRIYNNLLTGYIDIELIIDNLNNFAMDD